MLTMRKLQFSNGEYYHIYNRGVDHRSIVNDEIDSDRFVDSMRLFNTVELKGGIYEISFREDSKKLKFKDPLVDIIAYCLNPNHFHLCLCQRRKNGISEFMKRLSGGYAYYFNKRHKRTGSLLEGRFKAKHLDDNNYLLHVSCYVSLNDKVHKLSYPVSNLVRSSWEENTTDLEGICSNKIIEGQYSKIEYKKFALSNLPYMLSKRGDYEDLMNILHE